MLHKSGRPVLKPAAKQQLNKFEAWITPEFCAYYINNDLMNDRPLSNTTVAKYAKDMREGNWRLEGAPIRFGKTPPYKCIDGQHRFYACYEADKPFYTCVVEGVDESTFDVMDTGRVRTPGDMVAIQRNSTRPEGTPKTSDNKQIAAAANLVLCYRRGNMRPKALAAPTKQEITSFIRETPELIDWVQDSKGSGWTRSQHTLLATLGFLASHRYPHKAKEFIASFHSGENLVAGSPVLALRNRLGTEKNIHRIDRFALMVMAWNAYAKNRALTKIQLPRSDANYTFPKIEGAEKTS